MIVEALVNHADHLATTTAIIFLFSNMFCFCLIPLFICHNKISNKWGFNPGADPIQIFSINFTPCYFLNNLIGCSKFSSNQNA